MWYEYFYPEKRGPWIAQPFSGEDVRLVMYSPSHEEWSYFKLGIFCEFAVTKWPRLNPPQKKIKSPRLEEAGIIKLGFV